MSNEVNPYAAPVLESGPNTPSVPNPNAAHGLWREGNRLVTHIGAQLPDICVKTGEPTKERLFRKMQWHHPAIAIAILGGLLLYVILAVILTKRAQVWLPLSKDQLAVRKTRLLICWLIGLGCLAAIGLGIFLAITMRNPNEYSPLMFILLFGGGILGGLISLIAGSSIANVLKPTKITDTHIWLKGAHPNILNKLPNAR